MNVEKKYNVKIKCIYVKIVDHHSQPIISLSCGKNYAQNKVVDVMHLDFGEHEHVLVQDNIYSAVNSIVKY